MVLQVAPVEPAHKGGIIYLENRSAAETDDICGMRYWWSQLEGGGGIVHKTEADALRIGREIHEDMQALATADDLSPFMLEQLTQSIISMTPVEQKNQLVGMEQLYRRVGWITAWALYMEPRIRETFENVSVEGELILDRDPLWVAVTPDRVLRHKKDSWLKYMEFKSTITASNKWLASWKYAIQLHLGIKAIEEEFVARGVGEKIACAEIVGLMKGDVRNNHLIHPYVWGYYNSKSGKWSHEYQRGSDWQPRPVWEYEGGIVKWVQMCGEEVGREQFPFSPPVTLDERMLNRWVARRLSRQVEISEVAEECQKDMEAREIYFESRTRNCRPAFGDNCPYLGLCWNASMQREPLKSGDYKKRQPHHEVEALFG